MKIYSEAVSREWRRHYAWYPIRTEDFIWVWLETVEKKYFKCPLPNVIPNSWVVYRRIKKQ